MSKLDDLPESSSKFWDGEIRTNLVAHDILADHGHYFERVRGHEAYCTGCGWGFVLDPGDKIIDGHLYDRKGKLVI
jgi:hypothetical protein